MDLKPGYDSLNDLKDFKRKMEITLRRSLNTIRGCKEKGKKNKKKKREELWLNGSTPPSCQSSILGKRPGRVIS